MSYYAPMVAALVTLVLITMILYSKFGKQMQDIPNERSLHTRPTPRTGGIGLIGGALFGFGLNWHPLVLLIMACVFILVIISFLDDLSDLSPGLRLLMHFVIAGVYVGIAVPPSAGLLVISSLAFFTVWMINLYNFMDGSDGLAGGMALFGFSAYAVAACLASDSKLAAISLSVSAPALVFLYFNFNPARIFMGDAGSIPLGFMAAALGLLGWQHADWPIWFPALVFSPFIVDATVTLLKRLCKGEAIWQAHRSHYYQKLVLMGWSHRKTALAEYALMAATAASAIYQARHPGPWLIWGLLIWAGIYLIIALWIENRWRLHSPR